MLAALLLFVNQLVYSGSFNFYNNRADKICLGKYSIAENNLKLAKSKNLIEVTFSDFKRNGNYLELKIPSTATEKRSIKIDDVTEIRLHLEAGKSGVYIFFREFQYMTKVTSEDDATRIYDKIIAVIS
jgi:hypothetical protein